MQPLKNQAAIVTGAGSGIGRAIAVALGELGADLVLVGRRPAPLESVAAELKALGGKSQVYPVDLSERDSIQRFAQAVMQNDDDVDVLVHSAGAIRMANVAEASADDFDIMLRTNVLAPYFLTQLLIPRLRQRRGQVVFINSSVSGQAKAGLSQYAATKNALRAIADSLRAEVNADGIRVLSVYPGRTATPMQEGRTSHPGRLLQPADVAQMVVSALCLPRTAEVTDLHIRPMMKSE